MTEDVPPPRRTGAPPVNIDVTEYVFAAHADDQPVLATMSNAPGMLYLALFDNPGSLAVFHSRTGVAFQKIKQIMDGDDFVMSIHESNARLALEGEPCVTLIVDPWFTETGTIRFKQIVTSPAFDA